jgi:hypothetical protein
MGEFSVAVLCLAGFVFAVSSAMKLRSRRAYMSFRDGLGETGLVPGRLLPFTAVALCWVEAVTGAGLLAAAALTAVAASGAAPLAETMLAIAAWLTGVLAAGVASLVRRGSQARCACFGAVTSRPLNRAHLLRNLSLLAVVCAGLATVPLARPHPVPAGTLLAVMVGGVAAVLFIRWEDLADLLAPVPRRPADPRLTQRPSRDNN